MLELDGLTTRYGAITAIRELGLRVDEGEVVALIGPNGAGKTTTLGTIAGLLTPAAGSVRLDGEDVTGSAPDAMLRRGVALVPEHRRIFADLTVAENLQVAGITLGAGDRRARMDEQAEVFPVLAEKWTTAAGYLSGGEAQQLAVARALMTDPRLILMDEPSSALDVEGTRAIEDLILRLRGRYTILIVTHNMAQARRSSDECVFMLLGEVVEHGQTADLIARPKDSRTAAYIEGRFG